MTEFDDLYGSRFLAAADLKAPVTATIERIEYEPFARPNEPTRTKAVVYFRNGRKGMVINKTNANTMAAAFGKPFANWIGKRVTIKAEQTMMAGKSTLGLRLYPVNGVDKITSGPVKLPEPPPASPPPVRDDDMNDAIPF